MRAVDLFSGFGGFTAGAERAGVRVVWAANHWRTAVDVHAANHPNVEHACQDLRQANWYALPRFDLLLASPACQGHSEAGQPGRQRARAKHDADRSTAWAVVDCAEATRPRIVLVENVPSFRRWNLYPVWQLAMERLGYHLTEIDGSASVHGGVPQRRERLFIAATRRDMPASWRCVAWKGARGYAGEGNENRERERLWLSPHCLPLEGPSQTLLFTEEAS